MRRGAVPLSARSKVTDVRILAYIICMVICGCDSRSAVVDEPVYLYESASACHASAHAGPHDSVRGRNIRGVLATLEKGTGLALKGEDVGKEFACWRVKGPGIHGYVLASERISIVGQR
jgi:hypothetical protein